MLIPCVLALCTNGLLLIRAYINTSYFLGSDKERVLLVGSDKESLVSDEACFGLVPEGVSYRSDYSYQSYTSAVSGPRP